MGRSGSGCRRSLGPAALLGTLRVVGVVEALGDEAADADLTEVVEEGADLVGSAVDVVGVLVEEGEEPTPSGSWSAGFGSVCRVRFWISPVDFARFVYAQLAEAVVDRFELFFFSEDDAVQVADDVAGAVEGAVVGWRGEEEPYSGRSKAKAKARISWASNSRRRSPSSGRVRWRRCWLGGVVVRAVARGLGRFLPGSRPAALGPAESCRRRSR